MLRKRGEAAESTQPRPRARVSFAPGADGGARSSPEGSCSGNGESFSSIPEIPGRREDKGKVKRVAAVGGMEGSVADVSCDASSPSSSSRSPGASSPKVGPTSPKAGSSSPKAGCLSMEQESPGQTFPVALKAREPNNFKRVAALVARVEESAPDTRCAFLNGSGGYLGKRPLTTPPSSVYPFTSPRPSCNKQLSGSQRFGSARFLWVKVPVPMVPAFQIQIVLTNPS